MPALRPVCFMVVPDGRKPTQVEPGKRRAEIDFNALRGRACVPVKTFSAKALKALEALGESANTPGWGRVGRLAGRRPVCAVHFDGASDLPPAAA